MIEKSLTGGEGGNQAEQESHLACSAAFEKNFSISILKQYSLTLWCVSKFLFIEMLIK